MDVIAMIIVVLFVSNAMIRKALLPDKIGIAEFPLGSKRKATLDVLQSFFEGNIFRRREHQVEVIGHDDEFVEEKAALRAIVGKDVDQESGSLIGLEDGASSIGHGCEEERSDFLRCVHLPGLKPQDSKRSSRGPKGPLFHRFERSLFHPNSPKRFLTFWLPLVGPDARSWAAQPGPLEPN